MRRSLARLSVHLIVIRTNACSGSVVRVAGLRVSGDLNRAVRPRAAHSVLPGVACRRRRKEERGGLRAAHDGGDLLEGHGEHVVQNEREPLGGGEIDTTGGLWAEGKLADKVVGVFTSSSTLHGGQETTIASLFNVFAHWGAIIVTLGYTDEAIFTTGNPYGASSTEEPTEEELAVARYQGRRIAEKAEAIARSRA